MNLDTVVARGLALTHPELYRQLQEAITPMLKDTRHLVDMYRAVEVEHPELDLTDTRLHFVALVYLCYCPASFFPKSVMKLPQGIRDEAAKVMGYTNPENVNSWKVMAEAYMKGKTFRGKIEALRERFKCFSVYAADWELKLN